MKENLESKIWFGKHDPGVGDDFYINEFEDVPEDMHFYEEDLSDEPNIKFTDRLTIRLLKENGGLPIEMSGADVECEAPFIMEDGMLVWVVIGDHEEAMLYGLTRDTSDTLRIVYRAENTGIEHHIPDDDYPLSGWQADSDYPTAPVVWYS